MSKPLNTADAAASGATALFEGHRLEACSRPLQTIPNASSTGVIEHRPQLDALRAFAVFLVIVHHSSDQTWWLHLGSQGVKLFFVISGFLITGILLDCKSEVERAPDIIGRGFMLRQFYARRILRIFPPYYALLLLIALFAATRPAESAWIHSLKFHASYTSNFWFAVNGNFAPWPTVHFWSLAVEEQFYLFWPLFMLWLPRKHLWSAIMVLIISGPVFRAAMLGYSGSEFAGFLTPACFDALGLGALLALSRTIPRAKAVIRLLGLVSLIALSIISFAFLILDSALLIKYVQAVLVETLWALAFAALVSKASEGFRGRAGYLLNFRPLRYLGRISYGLYLYHLPIIFFVVICSEKLQLRSLSDGPIRLIVTATVSTLVASLSWHYFEEPINRLKRLFPYRTRRPAVTFSSPITASAPTS
jgi:peptidoglycan/LPS O-acetylase OafA/YrhL